MIRAYHAIFTAYGFWLPNDPRGSWSDFVGSWELFRFGPAKCWKCFLDDDEAIGRAIRYVEANPAK